MRRGTAWAAAATLMIGVAAAGCSTATDEPETDASPAVSSEQKPDKSQPAKQLSEAEQAELDEALIEAAWDNDVKRARTLIRQGADVNTVSDSQESAYLIATSEGYLDLLRLTLNNEAHINAKDSWNGTGLIRAAERGHANVVGRLLQEGIDRNHVNRIGYQALHEAVWLGEDTATYRDTVRALIAGGVQLDRASQSEGLTPLEMSREKGYDSVEEILETATSSDDIANANAALLAAAESGDAEQAALALRAGADIETRDGRERTPLLLASTYDNVAVARLLVAMGASPDALDDRHDTPWLVTGVTGSVEMLEALLPANPDMTIKNRYGGLSLVPAGEHGHVEYIRRVVETDIDLDKLNDLGWNAMLEAIILGDGGARHQEVVQILVDAGADTSVTDKDGVTPLEHAESRGYDEIARILRDG